MPTPSLPTGVRFKPIINEYGIGAPDGVDLSDIGGGMPRVARRWDRGRQPFQVTLILLSDEYSVWEAFFWGKIRKGSIQFNMPLDSGFGLKPHLCIMLPGSYSAKRAGGQVWSVSFVVLAESEGASLTEEEADSVIDVWEELGDETSALLARLAEYALEDTLVLEVGSVGP
jgi:hypothetical protein